MRLKTSEVYSARSVSQPVKNLEMCVVITCIAVASVIISIMIMCVVFYHYNYCHCYY